MNRQDRIQRSYIELAKALPWFHDKLASFDHEELADMLRKVFLNIFVSINHIAHLQSSSNEAQTQLVPTTRQLSKSSSLHG